MALAEPSAPPTDEPALLAVSGDSARKIHGDCRQSDAWIHTMQAEMFFGAWIVVNAAFLAWETDHQDNGNQDDWGWVLCDSIFNIVFTVEVILRMVAEKARWPYRAWNLIDFALVVIGIIDSWIFRIMRLAKVDVGGALGFLVVLRIFRLLRLARVLRVVRLLRSHKELLLLISGVEAGMKAMVWGAMLLVVVNFISALLMTELTTKKMFDGWFDMNEDEETAAFYVEGTFEKLYLSMFALFEITMEFSADYSMATWKDGPWLTMFFIAYFVISNLALLQVVGSIIVEAILTISEKHHQEDKALEKEGELSEAKETCEKLYTSLGEDSPARGGALAYKDLNFGNSKVSEYLKMAGIMPAQAAQLFQILDKGKTGFLSKDDFTKGLMRLKQEVNPKDIFKLETRLERLKRKIAAANGQQNELLEVAARIDAK